MLAGMGIGAFLLASAAPAAAAPTYTVGINNETASKTTTDGSAATASFTFRTDRKVVDQDGVTLDGAWVSSGATVGDYSIRVTVNSGSTPTGTLGSWLSLGSNRTWSLTDSAGASGSKTCSLKVEIRETASGTILDTATYTLIADSQTASPTVTFTPVPGTYSASDWTYVELAVSASASVVWDWSATNTTGLSASVASGGSGTSIIFGLQAGPAFDRSTTITLTVGSNTWTLNLTAWT